MTTHLHAFNFHTGRPRLHFEEGGDAAAAAATAAAAAAAGAKPWHAGVEAELVGHAQLKGWKLDDPKEAFGAAAKAARELEKHFGAPADRLVKMPASDAAPADIRAYYERLGAPKEAKDYDLSAVTNSTLADNLRAVVFEKGVPKDVASAIATTVAKGLTELTSQQNAVDTAKLADQKETLTKNWGDKYAYNHLQAIEGARKLGISPEAVKALEGVIGYDQVMEAMRKIGANTREDVLIGGGMVGTGEVTTVEAAKAKKQDLMADTAWVTRYNNGDAAARREMDHINKMIVGAAA